MKLIRRLEEIPVEERQIVKTSIQFTKMSRFLKEKAKTGQQISIEDNNLLQKLETNFRKATAENDVAVLTAQRHMSLKEPTPIIKNPTAPKGIDNPTRVASTIPLN